MSQRTPDPARQKLGFAQPLTLQENKPKGGRPKTFIHEHYIQDGTYNERAKRTGVSCRYCPFKTANSKVSVLIHHILEACPTVPRNVKEDVQQRSQALASRQQSLASHEDQQPEQPSTAKRKADSLDDRSATSRALDLKAIEAMDARLIRFIILCGISFNILDSPWFYDLVTALRSNYKPPGISQLPGLLVHEYQNVVERVVKALATASGITVVFDRRMHSPAKTAYHMTCVTEHGDLLPGMWKETASEAFDVSVVAAFMDDAVQNVGPQKIIAITTDLSSLNLLAAQETVRQLNYRHIITLPCAVHGFSLLAGACLGHSWPRSLLVKAQLLMVYIYSSPEIRAMLQPTSLLPPESSKEGVLLTLSGLEYTVTNLINMEQAVKLTLTLPTFNCRPDILDLANDAELWQGLKVLQPLLVAFCKVLTAVQNAGRRALLADMTRYFLFLARQAETLGPFVPQDYSNVVAMCMLKRMQMHDGPLQRLAMFLDPSFRSIVSDNVGMIALLQQAGVLLQNRNAEEAAMVRLIAQMQAYKAGTSPFEVPFLRGCDVRNWWLSVQMDKAPELVAIARQVVTACPVSASFDEVFRKAGWRLPPIPTCPPGNEPAIVSAIHTFYANKAPWMDNPRGAIAGPPIAAGPSALELLGMVSGDLDASLAALYSFWEEDSRELQGFGADTRQGAGDDASSFSQLLMGPWEKVPSELLDPNFEPPATARQPILPDLPTHAPAAWDVNAVLQQYMSTEHPC